MTDRRLAKTITVNRRGSTWRLEVDGEPFPWHVSSDGVTVTVAGAGDAQFPAVSLTIPAESVVVVHTLNPEDQP